MRIDKISISGLTTYREPQTLDLAALGPGVIAVEGPNGSGKTTLLEAIPGAIYRQTPSRGSIAGLATARDARIELAGENGHPFSVRLDLDCHNGKQEAVIFDEAGEPVAGPKVKEYDRVIAERFPSLDVYLASYFASQTGVGSVLRMSRSDRRALFGRLLGLERLEVMSTAARDRSRAVESEMTASQAALDAIRAGNENMDKLQADRATAREEQDMAAAATSVAEASLLSASAERARLAVARDDADRTARVAEAARIRVDDLTRKAATTAQVVENIETKRAALAEVLAAADEIRQAVEDIAEQERELERCRVEGEQVGERKAKAQAVVNDLAVAVMKGTSEKNEAARLRQEALDKIDSEKRRQAAAEKATAGVPCAGMLEDEQRSACPALVGHFRIQSDARDMLARLTEQEPALLERVLTTSSAVATSELSRKEAEAEVLKIDRELVVLRERYVHNKSSLEALRRRDRSAELQMAEREASVLDTSLSLAKENAAAATSDLAVAQAEYQKALAAVLPADGQALSAAVMTESSARQALDAARVRDQEALGAVVRLDTQISTAREAQARAEALRERLAPLERDLADWRWLGRALGREGVQALELDAAGPRISALANELLTDAYGSRFQLRFETQAAKADGRGIKETFDVVVVDTERGREGNGEDLSGGEKVIVGEALGLAVGLFHAQAAGVSLGTVVRDETVGALDPENGERYLAMLRSFLRVGRVHQLLYVAHNPALVELADAVIHVEDGRIEVR